MKDYGKHHDLVGASCQISAISWWDSIVAQKEYLVRPIHREANQQASYIKDWNSRRVHHDYVEHSNYLCISVLDHECWPSVLVLVFFLDQVLSFFHITGASSIPTSWAAFHWPETEVEPWSNRIEEASNSDEWSYCSVPVCIEVIKLTLKDRAIFRNRIKYLRCVFDSRVDYEQEKRSTDELDRPHLSGCTCKSFCYGVFAFIYWNLPEEYSQKPNKSWDKCRKTVYKRIGKCVVCEPLLASILSVFKRKVSDSQKTCFEFLQAVTIMYWAKGILFI